LKEQIITADEELRCSQEELATLMCQLEGEIAELRNEKCSAEEELRVVAHLARDAIITVDRRAHILRFNLAAERIFHRAAKDIIGESILQLVESASRCSLIRYLIQEGRAGLTGEQLTGRWHGRQMEGLRGDSEVFPIQVSVRLVIGFNLFVVLVHDLSKRQRTVSAITEVLTHRQHEIGREIHDGLGQELTALILLVSHLRQKSESGSLACAEDFDKLTEYVTRASDTARSLSRGLTAGSIDGLSLSDALQRLASRMETASGIPCSFASVGNVDIDDPKRIANLYRIAQEALSNAVRHAEATSIEIRLEGKPEGLLLSVRDNGKGIHERSKQGDGVGLRLMRHQVAALGGACNVESDPGAGTIVRCVVPLVS